MNIQLYISEKLQVVWKLMWYITALSVFFSQLKLTHGKK